MDIHNYLSRQAQHMFPCCHFRHMSRVSIISDCDVILKPGLYSSRRLSVAVAYSFVVRAGDNRVIASCRQNALKSFASINSRPTEWQNDPSTEFKFKYEFKFEFKFLD